MCLMNKLFIKFIGVFVILLFCLSPLGAIDLNQDGNVTHINGTDSTNVTNITNGADLNDLDDGIKDNISVEINESDNVSGNDSSIMEKNLESQNQTLNGSDEPPIPVTIFISVTVDAIYYKEHPVVKIMMDDDVLDWTTVYVTISGNGFSKQIPMRISNGYNELEFDNTLEPGDYNVRVEYRGGWRNPFNVTKTLTVKKLKPDLKMHIDDVNEEEHPTVRVETLDNLCNLRIYSPQFAQDYYLNLSHGSYNYEINEYLDPGVYTCYLEYPGNGLYEGALVSQEFTVTATRESSDLSMHVDNVVGNKKAVVNLYAAESFNRDVKVELTDSSNRTVISGNVKIVDGVGTFTADRYLDPGNYTAIATFDGDDTFRRCKAISNFTVRKDTDLRMKVTPHGRDVSVDVYSDNSLFSTLVKVKFNNSDRVYTAVLVNGYGALGFNDFAPGNYTATATFIGNDEYSCQEVTECFTIEE